MVLNCSNDSNETVAATGGAFCATDAERAASRLGGSPVEGELFCLATGLMPNGEFFISQFIDDAQASLTTIFASSPRDCHAEDGPASDGPHVITISLARSP